MPLRATSCLDNDRLSDHLQMKVFPQRSMSLDLCTKTSPGDLEKNRLRIRDHRRPLSRSVRDQVEATIRYLHTIGDSQRGPALRSPQKRGRQGRYLSWISCSVAHYNPGFCAWGILSHSFYLRDTTPATRAPTMQRTPITTPTKASIGELNSIPPTTGPATSITAPKQPSWRGVPIALRGGG